MDSITFGSTYRIPLVEQGITPPKREKLKKLANRYQNALYPSKDNGGYVRVSIRKRLDEGFEQNLRQIGFRVYQKFDRHNIPKRRIDDNGNLTYPMDDYIREKLATLEYQQKGKQMPKRK